MLILRSIWEGVGKDVPPSIVYWTLRLLMFTLSFVLEDWALQELVQSPRQRRIAIMMVASSYVTWTYQSHTFSNSIETLVVLWSLALIQRIVEDKEHSGAFACAVLAFIVTLGVFNRITFPAYIIIPAFQLLPHFKRKPIALLSIVSFGLLTATSAILMDTSFYRPGTPLFKTALKTPVITPFNNLLYNVATSNLAQHGLHPIYQHAAVNLPQLLGPAYLLIFTHRFYTTTRLVGAIFGTLILSIFPHQEARFLIPAVPLILSSVKLPKHATTLFFAAWITFNLFFGVLMGTYHQGGVVPMQLHIETMDNVNHVFWWKSYSPPLWLLDGKIDSMETTDLMGMQKESMMQELGGQVNCLKKSRNGVYLAAPYSATYLDKFVRNGTKMEKAAKTPKYGELYLEERWRYSKHLNLDDLDFGDDGVLPTLKRVVGRRGLVLWQVKVRCSGD
jgi:phosphatidylinositol glycan class Z